MNEHPVRWFLAWVGVGLPFGVLVGDDLISSLVAGFIGGIVIVSAVAAVGEWLIGDNNGRPRT